MRRSILQRTNAIRRIISKDNTCLRPLLFNSIKLFSTIKDDDSHDDFKPKTKVKIDPEEGIDGVIKDLVTKNDVFLFMKGTAEQPQCGFSYQVVRVLLAQGVDFKTANVLTNADLREGIKKFSNWPTIPQLYVKGEFVGGCDIVTQMHQSGDLEELLKEKKIL